MVDKAPTDLTILLVEDGDDTRYFMRLELESLGYRVIEAEDGYKAVDLALSEHPDIILMDLSLPVLDGWEATRRIKAAPETWHIPVIALTAHAMSGDRETALAAGCDDFDTKPINLPRLLDKIRALLPQDEAP